MLNKTTRVKSFELTLKIKPQKDGGFVAVSSVWKDCYAQADTIDEAVLEATAVAQALIELYQEEEIEIPLKQLNEKKTSAPITIPVVVAA
jgi:predicted RNase H-like HicB family nuclease